MSFNIEELIEASDNDLFNKLRNRIHCLSSLLPPSPMMTRCHDDVDKLGDVDNAVTDSRDGGQCLARHNDAELSTNEQLLGLFSRL